MADYLRLRQICLVAPQLGPAERVMTDVLGLRVCHRDPNVATYGLENALWPVGDMFLEVVAPTRPDTAAGRFLARSGGRGGYMVIFDCSDPERRAGHARGLSVRIAAELAHEGYTGVQLHPRDCRAAMIEFNRTAGGDRDPTHYAPAGPDWQAARSSAVTRRIRAIELGTPDPVGLCAHWAAIIEQSVEQGSLRIPFAESTLRFVTSDDDGERLAALALEVTAAPDMLARATDAGLPRTDRGFFAVGVEWVPVQP